MARLNIQDALRKEIEASEGRVRRKPFEDYEECPDWFHPGQTDAWSKPQDVILVLAGIQSGKTVFGPRWLRREIQRTACEIKSDADPPNDYLIAGPTLSLLRRKAIPEFLRVFPSAPEWGHFDKANSIYTFSAEGSKKLLGYVTPITIYFGYAENPDSLAAMTTKAVWIDEGGQRQFKRDSYEEIRNRTTTTGARILITTTAYVQAGWLREEHDRAEAHDPHVGLTRFKTSDLGDFLKLAGDNRGQLILDAVARDKKRLPAWLFSMRREGRFEKAPGAVYDCFEGEFGQEKRHTVPRFEIPSNWKRYWGLDFGPVHTCCVMAAEDPETKKLYVYGCYFPQERGDGRRTYTQHAKSMRSLSLMFTKDKKLVEPEAVYGGAKNEDNHRVQYQREGIGVRPPRFENDVARQIEATYGALKGDDVVFFNDLRGLIAEFLTYSYDVDEDQNVDDAKIVSKAAYHRLDAVRYLVASIRPGFSVEAKVVGRFEDTKKKDLLPFRM